jgi:BMFP domain-containing protein YqiC
MLILQWVREMCDKLGETEKLSARIRELEGQLEKARDENLALARKMEALEGRITAFL